MVELVLGIFDSLELRIVFSCIRPSHPWLVSVCFSVMQI